jgi:hypothetical protein
MNNSIGGVGPGYGSGPTPSLPANAAVALREELARHASRIADIRARLSSFLDCLLGEMPPRGPTDGARASNAAQAPINDNVFNVASRLRNEIEELEGEMIRIMGGSL